MTGRPSVRALRAGFTLPVFDRLAPAPPPELVAARIEAHTGAGDVVADLFGRGGWVARAAIDRQRRAVSLESSPLTRLLAEVVLRPPDVRHLDAAFQGMSASPRRESSLKVSLGDLFATRCATCGRMLVADEFVWAAGRTTATRSRRSPRVYRCTVCRDQRGGDRAAPGAARRRRPRPGPARPGGRGRRAASSRDRFPAGRRRAGPGRRAARPAHAPPARRPRRDPRRGSRATCGRRRSWPRCGWPSSTPSCRRAGSRRRAGPATLRIAGGHVRLPGPATSGASATRGSRSRTASGWSAASSSASRAARSGRSRRGSARTCAASRGDRDRASLGLVGSPSASARCATGRRIRRSGRGRPARSGSSSASRRSGPARSGSAAATTARPGCSGARRRRCCPSTRWRSRRCAPRGAGRPPRSADRSRPVEPAIARDGRVVLLVDGGPEALARPPSAASAPATASSSRPARRPDDDGRASSSWCRPAPSLPPGPRTRANVGARAGARRRRRPGPRPGPGLFAAARALRPAAVLGAPRPPGP